MNPLFDLTGRKALVTGGSRGLGAAIAIGLAEAGATVAVTSRSGQAADTQTALTKRNAFGGVFAAEFSGQTDGEALIGQARDAMGGLDILVTNAGVQRRAPVLDYPDETWQELLNVNLHAVWQLSRAAGRHMVEQGGGKIIHVASVLALQGGYTVPAYVAAKHGVAGLTKAMANELAARGVNVNAIAPGYMATDMNEGLLDDEDRNRQILERIPAGRWGESSEVAGAAVFLASDAGSYVHGHILVVDGGWMSR